MRERSSRFWVWRSTEDSRTAGKLSLLAVAETLLCVALYWTLLLRFGVTWHHWLIVIATPLVLLRSAQSIQTGRKWFNSYIARGKVPPKSVHGGAIIGVSVASTALASWLLFTYIEDSVTESELQFFLFYSCLLSGATGAISIARAGLSPPYALILVTVALWCAIIANGQYSALILAFGMMATITFWTVDAARHQSESKSGLFQHAPPPETFGIKAFMLFLILFPVFFAVGFGILIRSMAIRFTSTLVFLLPGINQLPDNFLFATMVSDIYHPPELIPGNRTFTYGEAYSISRINRSKLKLPLFEYVMGLAFIPVFYIPTVVWRWSIKSTAWFYIPLLWVRRGWRHFEGDELAVWAQSYSSKAVNWAWLILGGVSIVAVTITLFSFDKWSTLQESLGQTDAPVTFLGVLYALDWYELLKQPWLLFYVPSYILTVIIFFHLDSIAKEIRLGGVAPASRALEMQRWMWAANFRAMLTNIGLAIALWYFLSAVDAWSQFETAIADLL